MHCALPIVYYKQFGYRTIRNWELGNNFPNYSTLYTDFNDNLKSVWLLFSEL